MYQVVTCTFCGSVHVDKGKYKKFNHVSHKCFHCGLFFQITVPCVGIEPVVQQPVSSPVTNRAVRSNVAPALDVTRLRNVCRLLLVALCLASDSLHVGVLQLCVKSAQMTVVLVSIHRAPRA